jgi:hypothetical protein
MPYLEFTIFTYAWSDVTFGMIIACSVNLVSPDGLMVEVTTLRDRIS